MVLRLNYQKIKEYSSGLFDNSPNNYDEIPKLPDYNFKERLKQEYAWFETTISDHPLELSSPPLEKLEKIVLAKDLKKYMNKTVCLWGRMITRKKTRTNKGEIMMFLSLEDRTGTMEVVFFPPVYKQYAHILTGTGPFKIKGTIKNDLGSISIEALYVK